MNCPGCDGGVSCGCSPEDASPERHCEECGVELSPQEQLSHVSVCCPCFREEAVKYLPPEELAKICRCAPSEGRVAA